MHKKRFRIIQNPKRVVVPNMVDTHTSLSVENVGTELMSLQTSNSTDLTLKLSKMFAYQPLGLNKINTAA